MSIIEFLVILIIFGIAIKGFTSYKLAYTNELPSEIIRNDKRKVERIIVWTILLIPIIIIGMVLLLHYN